MVGRPWMQLGLNQFYLWVNLWSEPINSTTLFENTNLSLVFWSLQKIANEELPLG